MVTCSNGGGPDFSGNFYDPAKANKTIADHIKFVRDFIKPFGYCDHFKMNMGPRPPGYDTNDETDQGLRRRAEPDRQADHQGWASSWRRIRM